MTNRPVAGLDAVLAARQARAGRQQDMIGRAGCPVVSLTMVAPGPAKYSMATARAFGLAASTVTVELARRRWRVIERHELHADTGPELQLAVAAASPGLKQAMIRLEDECAWGRLWDIDVVTAAGPLSRSTAGEPPRRCLVCPGDAASCARSRRHAMLAVVAAANRILRRSTAASMPHLPAGPIVPEAIGSLAAEALRAEARLAPKPGLVDVFDSGAHADMTVEHLLASADALEPWFVQMAALGMRTGWTVSRLQELGHAAEDAMSAATGGVNTHKGAVFVLGWLCAASGGTASADEPARLPGAAGQASCRDENLIAARVRHLAAPVLERWLTVGTAHAEDTHGRRALADHGLLGARGEAATGFGSVVQHALPRYRQALDAGWAPDEALLAALVTLMARVDDTNLVSRGGLDALRSVREWAATLDRPSVTRSQLVDALSVANRRFTERRWSPGGSADLLAATWFLHELNPYPAGPATHAEALLIDEPAVGPLAAHAAL